MIKNSLAFNTRFLKKTFKNLKEKLYIIVIDKFMFYVFSCKTSATLFGILKKKQTIFFQKNAVFNIDQSFSLK